MRPVIVYVYALNNPAYATWAQRFIDSYKANPPLHDHDTLVGFTNGEPSEADKDAFRFLPNVEWFQHDNSGWDIGFFIAASKILTNPMALYLGNPAHFKRAGWLARMVSVYQQYGTGFYGSLSSYEISPHLNTSGFWTDPLLMAGYPIPVVDNETRCRFELGPSCMWRLVHREGLPVKLVTWNEIEDWPQWRTPRNIFKRGDQSNCMTYFRHSATYDHADEGTRRAWAERSDVIVDPDFMGAHFGRENYV